MLDDVLSDAHGDTLVADNAVDNGVDLFLAVSGLMMQNSYMRPSDPRRLELRPKRHYQQRAKVPDHVDRPIENF